MIEQVVWLKVLLPKPHRSLIIIVHLQPLTRPALMLEGDSTTMLNLGLF